MVRRLLRTPESMRVQSAARVQPLRVHTMVCANARKRSALLAIWSSNLVSSLTSVVLRAHAPLSAYVQVAGSCAKVTFRLQGRDDNASSTRKRRHSDLRTGDAGTGRRRYGAQETMIAPSALKFPETDARGQTNSPRVPLNLDDRAIMLRSLGRRAKRTIALRSLCSSKSEPHGP